MNLFKTGTAILFAGIGPLLLWALFGPKDTAGFGPGLLRVVALLGTTVGGAAVAIGLVQWFVARLRD